MLTALANWFKANEYIAIWAEGIALVAIFIWDRLDSRAQHRETMEQLRINQDQATASRLAAQSLINAERAWVMAELDWPKELARILENTSESPEGRSQTTVARVMMQCSNEGKTPAWIDGIYGRMEIIRSALGREVPARDQMQSFGMIGPLGAGNKRPRFIPFECQGHRQEGEYLEVYLLVEYHDIFGMKRETHVGYVIFDENNIARQERLPERNRNT